ncbi:PAS-domain containing protein [Tropicibacter sp. S64]|uniref:PAS domain-containing hybrid sensor histidine kinase/response regulator n=1 Tax=Tropicibacter sp. S64 TaxID=3415122 RepID=UPI003C7DBC55
MLVDPHLSAEEKVARQAKIIDALMRRANRQKELGLSAYSAFQAAIELRAQIAEKTRDLELAASELEVVRGAQEKTRANLDHALAAMEGGFALFTDGTLSICNELFRSLMPDIATRIKPGLGLEAYFSLITQSDWLKSTDRKLHSSMAHVGGPDGGSVLSITIELKGDRWYQLSSQLTGSNDVVLLLTEITAIVRQNRSEKESLIDKQAAYLQAVFENMSSGFCTFSPDGEVMILNNQFRVLLGLPFTLLQQGTPLSRLLDFARRHELMSEEALRNLEDWQAQMQEEEGLRLRVAHGSQRVLDLQAHVLPDGGFVIELKDVTLESRAKETLERRVLERTAELTQANLRLTQQYEQQARVEEELRLAKERAEAAVSSKTRFLAAASHDLLQPINAAKLLLANLMETTEATQFYPSVTRLHRAFTSTEQLLRSLLDISRLDGAETDAIKPSEVCLAGLMQGVFEDQSALAEQKGVKLSVVPSMAFVRSDPVYLLRSLQNLVVNAIEYNRPGGRVVVGCRRRQGKLQLQVWDDGIGISRRDQERIFEEFGRAENAPMGSGMGLGLSVVERACRHLGHKLWLRSKPGAGSIFCIELDEIAAPLVMAEDEPILSTPNDQRLDLITLVIENDEDVLFATTEMLQSWGADVLPVRSTEEALRHVRDMGMPPDIILADYQLDGDDTGVRTIREIRALTRVKVPAILITANRSDTLMEAGRDIGFSVMTKPVQVSRLRPLIEWKVRWQSPQTEVEPPVREGAAPTKVDTDSTGAGAHAGAGEDER